METESQKSNMKKKQVLKITGRWTWGGEREEYISRVTKRRIYIICNDIAETCYSKTGSSIPREKFQTYRINTVLIAKFLKERGIEEWDGGWKPSCNAKGKQVREVPDLFHYKTKEEWFEAQDVEIIDLTK